jgi:pilus assembly protein CpaB
MRAKSLALLVVALGCGLVAMLGITQVLAKRNVVEVPTAGDTDSIFVAMKDIAQGDPLNAQVLKLEQWPKNKVPQGGLGNLADIEGRRARTSLYAGEPILDNLLLPKGASQQTAGGMIPKGYRAVAIRVDAASGGGDLVLPGDRVDLLVHMARNDAIGIHETTTRTVLQDIKVFAVNAQVSSDANGPDTKSIAARTVSLLVTPQQAEKVTLASELGTIKLVIRSPEDDVQTKIDDGTVVRDLFGGADRARRDKERAGEGLLGEKKEPAQGFHDFIEGVRKQVDAEKGAAAEPAKNTWAMRILIGGEVKDVTMEGSGDQSATDPGTWKVSNSPGGGGQPATSGGVQPATDAKRPSPWAQKPGEGSKAAPADKRPPPS